jgi:hypothetical protein
MNDNELRGLFSEMREEPVPAESLARVRMAVTERVEARRRRVAASWKIAVPLAVACCVTVVMLRPKAVTPVPVAPVVEVEQQSAPVQVASPKPVVRKRVGAAVSHVQPAPIEGGASEIRIESPLEPDVVIVLIGG